MSWNAWPFGKPALESRMQQEAEAALTFENARDMVVDRIELATVDHTGRRLNERRWRYLRDFVGSLE